MKWNILLASVTFFLSVFGTFITRSGVISSVHSFALSDIGPLFAGFLLVITVFSAAVFIFGKKDFGAGGGVFESALSRESAFVFNNVLFLSVAFVVFLGTVFPIISEAVTGDRILVGPPYFNRLNTPLGLVLITLMGAATVMPWRGMPPKSFARSLAVPLACGIAVLTVLIFYGIKSPVALAAFSLCVFCLVASAREMLKILKTVKGKAHLLGGHIVHTGVALIVIGVTASSVFADKHEVTMNPGDAFSVGNYELKYLSTDRSETPAKEVVAARIQVSNGGRPAGVLIAEKNFYLYEGNREINRETEVGLLSSWREDLYVVLMEAGVGGSALLAVVLNPLVSWIWAGGAVLIFGAILSFSGGRR